jgi:hypothetical protein
MKTLLLYANYASTSSYYDDWLDAFSQDPDLECDTLDICRIGAKSPLNNLQDYELIIALHSTTADSLSYLEGLVPRLLSRNGIFGVFVGNEVNLPGSPMGAKLELLQRLRPDYIFTQLLQETGEWLYEPCKPSRVFSVPHALNEKVFFPVKNYVERSKTVGVRSFQYGIHIGDEERTVFFKKVSGELDRRGLANDIDFDPTKRFARAEWAQFLNECKATLATEAGSYYLERDDRFVNLIQEYILSHRNNSKTRIVKHDSLLRRAYHTLPPKLKDAVKFFYFKYADRLNIKYEHLLSDERMFHQVYEEIIKEYPPCPLHSKAISSRQFDAIGTKTCLVMLEGRYNDILVPNEHYIEVKKDYSNLSEAIEKVCDQTYVERMTNEVYEYVKSRHLHRHRVESIKKLIEEGEA